MSVLAPERPRLQPANRKPVDEVGRVVVHNVPWDRYVALTESLVNNPGLRTTYVSGNLELMSTSNLHEWLKKRLGRFLEIIAEEFGVSIQPGGNTTFRNEELEQGFEPDDCFWIASEARMRVPVNVWDPSRDPPPDLIIEIEVTRSALNRMSVFAAYRVPEVWRYDGEALHIHRLTGAGRYEEVVATPTFPGIPVGDIASFLRPDSGTDYLTALRQFRKWVKGHLSPAKQKGRRRKS
jgi:Uma2 family endonuclease